MRMTRLLAPGLVAFVIALVVSGVLVAQSVPGLPTSPLLTLVLVPIARMAMFLTGAIALAGALLGGILGGAPDTLRLATTALRVYAASVATVLLATLADVMAVEPWQAVDVTLIRSFTTQIDEGQYLLSQLAIAGFISWFLPRAKNTVEYGFATLAIAIAIALQAFSGHSAAALPHWLASALMVPHLLAISVWLGGVIVLAVSPSGPALHAFRRMVRVIVPTILLSGLGSVFARVNDWSDFARDRYAVVLLAKVVLTFGVIALGYRVGRSVDRDATSAEVRQALAREAMLMVGVLGIGVVLARMANP